MSPVLQIILSLLAVAAGATGALQQILNANLRTELGSPWWAGFVSCLGGTIVMFTVAALAPGSRPSLSIIGESSWVAWTGTHWSAVSP